jgi:threonine dehydrogenase-like Zn-dependent dehydrogenase
MSMGATAAFGVDDPSLRDLLQARRGQFDAVIDAVGKEEIINGALPLVRMGGSVCVYGVIDTPVVRLDKSAAPYNFNLLIHQWPTRSRERAAQEPLIEWILAGKLSYKEFISAEFPIAAISQAYQWAQDNKAIKTLFRY